MTTEYRVTDEVVKYCTIYSYTDKYSTVHVLEQMSTILIHTV